MVSVVELFAGPGGWDEGARLLGANLDIRGFDISRDAVATAKAAGHRRTRMDVSVLEPRSFPDASGLIASPPCPTFSDGGKRTGRGDDYQKVLDVWTSIGWGIPMSEALSSIHDVEDRRTALLAIAGAFALGMGTQWAVFEQVPAVEFAWEDLAAEFLAQGWEDADVFTIEAADYGVPSRRRRAFLVASRHVPLAALTLNRSTLSMADALGWAPGHRVITRGQRRTSGGNAFSADGPSWCLTGSSRSWEREDGLRLTTAEAGVLVGFDADYPWQGSRSSAFLQAADVVSPPVAAGVLSRVLANNT
jgi:DNA (cytosine-5)-methyltransferase 1